MTSDREKTLNVYGYHAKIYDGGLLNICSICFLILTLPITLTYKNLSIDLHQCMAQIMQVFHQSDPVPVQLQLQATIALLVAFRSFSTQNTVV